MSRRSLSTPGAGPVLGVAILCFGAAVLLGCSLTRPAPKAAPPPPPVAVVKPALPTPVATHRLRLEPADSDVLGYVQRTIVGPEDTLPDIARRFDVGYEEMLLANPGVDPWLPGVGREVVVPSEFVLPAAPREGVVVNIAAMRIFYFPPHKKGTPQLVFTHPIGIGRVGWQTPEGTTKIVSRQKDPVWIPPKSVRDEHAADGDKLPPKIPAGPDNPLGQHMFRLGWPTYLIHGTNKPYGVGMRSSHGCIRLYPEDIAVLFDLVPIGTPVTIVNQPYLFGWRDGVPYLQAYAVLEDDARAHGKSGKRVVDRMLSAKLRERVAAHDKEFDWNRVAELARKPRAIPVPVGTALPGIETVVAESRLVANTVPTGSNWNGKSELLIDEKTFRDMLGARDKSPPLTQSR